MPLFAPMRLLLGGVAALSVFGLACAPAGDPTPQLPPLMLWAWDRPEDLSHLDPRHAGVAVLVGTAILAGGDVELSPRLQPIRLPPDGPVVAVVRIETSRVSAPVLSAEQIDRLVGATLQWTKGPRNAAVQIDFDARKSERDFYREYLSRLREELPAATPLTITALASWCLGDPWIRGLPIAEAVPMLFEMGPDDATIRRHLSGGGDFRLDVCRHSVGLATYEERPAIPQNRRVYLFHSRSWTREDAARAQSASEGQP